MCQLKRHTLLFLLTFFLFSKKIPYLCLGGALNYVTAWQWMEAESANGAVLTKQNEACSEENIPTTVQIKVATHI